MDKIAEETAKLPEICPYCKCKLELMDSIIGDPICAVCINCDEIFEGKENED